MMNGGPVSWKSVKQKSVSLSTAESEWYAASEAGKELLYLRIIMREFGFPQLGPMHLYEDSRAVIAMAENPCNRKGARHIGTREHFVDQLVKDRIVKLVQCRTNKMVADALTENLPAPAFEQDRATMLGEELLDMFFVHEQKLSLNLPQPFKEQKRAARDFCRLQYTRKRGQAREWRV
jgi:hypothetical protein